MTDSDFAWIAEHSSELFEQYRGQWIAVHDGQVVGVGNTAPEAAEQAREHDPNGEFILEGLDKEADVIYGAL